MRRTSEVLLRRAGKDAVVKADREKPLLLLPRKVYQLTELLNQRLRLRIGLLGGLHFALLVAIAKSHDLNKPSGALAAAPIGAGLLIDLEILAAQPRQRLAKAVEQPRVLGALVLGDNVAVGLQKHVKQ